MVDDHQNIPVPDDRVDPLTQLTQGAPEVTPPPTPQANDSGSKPASLPGSKNTPKLSAPRLPLILGALLVVITGAAAALFYLSGAQKPQAELAIAPTPQPTPQVLFLTLDQETETTAVNGEVLVKGRTLPNTVVMAYSAADAVSLESDLQGNFESTLVVDDGGIVEITAFGEDGQEAFQTYTYATVVLGEKDEAAANSQAADKSQKTEKPAVATAAMERSGKDVKTTKAEVTKAPNPNKKNGEAGLVASLDAKYEFEADDNVSGKAKEKAMNLSASEAKKVRDFLVTEEVPDKPRKIGAQALKDLKASLDATGSAAAAKKRGLEIKEMKVMAATEGAQLKRHAISGVIVDLTADTIVLAHQTQSDRQNTVFYNAATIIASKDKDASDSAQLAVGQRIAAVGEPVVDGLMAKRIHIIPGKAYGVVKQQPAKIENDEDATGSGQAPTPTASASATPTVISTPTASPLPSTTSGNPSPTSAIQF